MALLDRLTPGVELHGKGWCGRASGRRKRASPIGQRAAAGEVNRRYRGKLKKPVNTRATSIVLRRMHAEGKLQLVRPGKAFHL